MWGWCIACFILGYILGIGSMLSECNEKVRFYKLMMLNMMKDRWSK